MTGTGPVLFPQKLAQLRKREGLTQARFAERLGLAQSLISQVERGERQLTVDVMNRAIQNFDIPLDYFSLEPVTYERESLNYRRMDISAKQQDALRYIFGEREQEVRKSMAPFPTVDVTQMTPERDIELSVEEIEDRAQATRSLLRLGPDTPVPNVTRAVEAAGIPVMELKSDVLDEKKIDGVSTPHTPIDYPVIAYIPKSSGDRHRFTVAHELGHLVLHLRYRPEAEEIREGEANKFAGAFLLPRDSMVGSVNEALGLQGYASLKATWGVSIQALIRRAHTLEIISDKRYKSLMIQLSNRGWRKSEPVRVGVERPVLVKKFMRRADRSNVVPLIDRFRRGATG